MYEQCDFSNVLQPFRDDYVQKALFTAVTNVVSVLGDGLTSCFIASFCFFGTVLDFFNELSQGNFHELIVLQIVGPGQQIANMKKSTTN